MTYSIVARDPETGEIGVAVQTALPCVGAICPFAQAGVGAVASQAWSRRSHGPSGLELMRNGHTAPEALAAVLQGDPQRDVRQVGMIDAKGNVDSFTGNDTIRYAGNHVGDNYAVQANMMATDAVPPAMAKAFESTKGSLLMRIIAALEAAQAEGGDFRGQQSAGLLIVSGELQPNTWDGKIYDIRVDDHPTPIVELKRIATLQSAYKALNSALELGATEDYDGAMDAYETVMQLAPGDQQLRYSFSYVMSDEYGQFELVKDIWRGLFADNPMWVEHVERQSDARALKHDGLREKILAIAQR
jgi:uncharacterized Ntn-hydrolase superfamily protein